MILFAGNLLFMFLWLARQINFLHRCVSQSSFGKQILRAYITNGVEFWFLVLLFDASTRSFGRWLVHRLVSAMNLNRFSFSNGSPYNPSRGTFESILETLSLSICHLCSCSPWKSPTQRSRALGEQKTLMRLHLKSDQVITQLWINAKSPQAAIFMRRLKNRQIVKLQCAVLNGILEG